MMKRMNVISSAKYGVAASRLEHKPREDEHCRNQAHEHSPKMRDSRAADGSGSTKLQEGDQHREQEYRWPTLHICEGHAAAERASPKLAADAPAKTEHAGSASAPMKLPAWTWRCSGAKRTEPKRFSPRHANETESDHGDQPFGPRRLDEDGTQPPPSLIIMIFGAKRPPQRARKPSSNRVPHALLMAPQARRDSDCGGRTPPSRASLWRRSGQSCVVHHLVRVGVRHHRLWVEHAQCGPRVERVCDPGNLSIGSLCLRCRIGKAHLSCQLALSPLLLPVVVACRSEPCLCGAVASAASASLRAASCSVSRALAAAMLS